MNNDTQRRTDGYYDEEGEFYPNGTAPSVSREALYPKRPPIQYTTEPIPGTQLPEVIQKDISDEPPKPSFKQCAHCGKQNKADSLFCADCGKPLPLDGEEVRYCRHCGAQLGVYDTYCPHCSKQDAVFFNVTASPQNTQGEPKSKKTALLLCVFLGWAGVHRFYEGKIKTGILWLLTGGLWGVGTIVDIIRIAMKPDTYYV